jgi:hypothetical protein
MTVEPDDELRMESAVERLTRFRDGSPTEVIATLLNSIDNFLNPEIHKAAEHHCWSLVLMGTHAVAVTISEGLFGLPGKAGFVRFVTDFMDQGETDPPFVEIAGDLHHWRTVVSHQWLSTAGHYFGFDENITVAWERRGDILVVNPIHYHEAYRQAFSAPSNLWRARKWMSEPDLEAARTRLLDKYVKR